MIINIRGTSGSGKSSLARRVMEQYTGGRVRIKKEGRTRPYGYILSRGGGGKALYVPGHYECPCGGCDTIKGLDEVFSQVRGGHDFGLDVLFEGLIVCSDHNRTRALKDDGYPLLVVSLNLSVDECVESINIRRRAKKADALPVPRKNTESKWKTNNSIMAKFQAGGVRAESHSREDGFRRICEELKI